jgi:hypothetical protein
MPEGYRYCFRCLEAKNTAAVERGVQGTQAQRNSFQHREMVQFDGNTNFQDTEQAICSDEK